jgi:hypothetical protein
MVPPPASIRKRSFNPQGARYDTAEEKAASFLDALIKHLRSGVVDS